MNLFALTSIACGVFCTILALVTLIFGRAKIHRILAFFNISVAIWGCGCFWVSRAASEPMALLGWRFGQSGGIFIATLFYHLVCIFCGLQRRIQLIVVYIWSMFFLYFCFFTNLLFAKTRLIYNIPYYNDATWLYAGLVFSWLFIVCLSFFELLRFFPKAKGAKRIQTLYIIFGFLTGFVGGASTLIPMFRIPIYPFGNITIPIYCLIATYAILRHHLMDVDVVIKKTVVFATLLTIIFGIFVGITFLIQQFIMGGRLLGAVISCSIIILAYRPIEKFLVAVTDKYLFQKKYDTHQILRSFINNVITLLDINKIISGTSELSEKTFHPENIAILLLDNDDDKYISQKIVGHNKELVIEKNSAIPNYLISSKNIFSIEEPNNTKADKNLLMQMKSYSAHLAIPLLIHDNLIGIILLGKKKSDEYYTSEDLNVLSDLAKTEAIAISNSKTHALLLQVQQKEEQSNRLLSLAYLVTNLSHELRNPLNLISGCAKVAIDTVAFKTKDLPHNEEYQNILSHTVKKHAEIMEISKKASDMLNAILNSMKIDKSKFVPVDLRSIVHEAIKRAEADAYSANIKLLNNIPHNFAKVNGDYITLEQVFFNIIHNAIEAMIRNGKGDQVEVSAVDMNKKIKLKIVDNGPGIPKHDLERIFEPFYTTKVNLYKYTISQSKGVGLGLTIANNNVKSHGGIVHVESEEGKGTTFVVELPKDGGVSSG